MLLGSMSCVSGCVPSAGSVSTHLTHCPPITPPIPIIVELPPQAIHIKRFPTSPSQQRNSLLSSVHISTAPTPPSLNAQPAAQTFVNQQQQQQQHAAERQQIQSVLMHLSQFNCPYISFRYVDPSTTSYCDLLLHMSHLLDSFIVHGVPLTSNMSLIPKWHTAAVARSSSDTHAIVVVCDVNVVHMPPDAQNRDNMQHAVNQQQTGLQPRISTESFMHNYHSPDLLGSYAPFVGGDRDPYPVSLSQHLEPLPRQELYYTQSRMMDEQHENFMSRFHQNYNERMIAEHNQFAQRAAALHLQSVVASSPHSTVMAAPSPTTMYSAAPFNASAAVQPIITQPQTSTVVSHSSSSPALSTSLHPGSSSSSSVESAPAVLASVIAPPDAATSHENGAAQHAASFNTLSDDDESSNSDSSDDDCEEPRPTIVTAAVVKPHHDASNYHKGTSCHQCKNTKSLRNLAFCSNSFDKRTKQSEKRNCRKKFCSACLMKFYNTDIKDINMTGWICASCVGICSCAACTRHASKKKKKRADKEMKRRAKAAKAQQTNASVVNHSIPASTEAFVRESVIDSHSGVAPHTSVVMTSISVSLEHNSSISSKQANQQVHHERNSAFAPVVPHTLSTISSSSLFPSSSDSVSSNPSVCHPPGITLWNKDGEYEPSLPHMASTSALSRYSSKADSKAVTATAAQSRVANSAFTSLSHKPLTLTANPATDTSPAHSPVPAHPTPFVPVAPKFSDAAPSSLPTTQPFVPTIPQHLTQANHTSSTPVSTSTPPSRIIMPVPIHNQSSSSSLHSNATTPPLLRHATSLPQTSFKHTPSNAISNDTTNNSRSSLISASSSSPSAVIRMLHIASNSCSDASSPATSNPNSPFIRHRELSSTGKAASPSLTKRFLSQQRDWPLNKIRSPERSPVLPQRGLSVSTIASPSHRSTRSISSIAGVRNSISLIHSDDSEDVSSPHSVASSTASSLTRSIQSSFRTLSTHHQASVRHDHINHDSPIMHDNEKDIHATVRGDNTPESSLNSSVSSLSSASSFSGHTPHSHLAASDSPRVSQPDIEMNTDDNINKQLVIQPNNNEIPTLHTPL